MTLIFKDTKKRNPHRDTGLTVPEVKHNKLLIKCKILSDSV